MSELIEDRLTAIEGLMRGLTLRPDGAQAARRSPSRSTSGTSGTGPRRPDAHPPHRLEETYDLADALVVAMHLNAFIRHAASVRMANLAQLVNVIAPIITTPGRPPAPDDLPPVRAVQPDDRPVALDAWWDGDTFSGGDQGVRILDVSASLDPDAPPPHRPRRQPRPDRCPRGRRRACGGPAGQSRRDQHDRRRRPSA